MKGLLIKDLRQLATQKSFLLIMIAICLLLISTNNSPSFIISYMGFMLLLLSISTITMDDTDHGLTFLFTLPFSRKAYVIEKYILTLALTLLGWSATFALVIVLAPIQETNIDELKITGLLVLPIMLIFIAILLPIQLRFSGSQARLASYVALGLFFAAFASAQFILDAFGAGGAVTTLINNLINLPTAAIALIISAFCLCALAISTAISLRVIKRREY